MFEIDENMAEETGIHVGDGSMNIYGRVHAYTVAGHHIDDREYIEKIVVPLCKKNYDIQAKPRNWSQGTYGFRIHNKEIITFKHEILGLPLGKKKNIIVPTCILSSKKLTKAFLRGLTDTDGGIHAFRIKNGSLYPRIQISNTSKILMQQVNNMLKELNFRTTTWTATKNHERWHEIYRISINGEKMLRKWLNEIGFHNPKHLKKALKLLNSE